MPLDRRPEGNNFLVCFPFACHPERNEVKSKDLGSIDGAKIPPCAAFSRNDKGAENESVHNSVKKF